ncbi:MAG: hypothetical protein H0U89_08810 [Acidimicrobiia bacterium]|nr:hypothetical protein [Acidimicrobiia bacterium]
MEVALGLRPHSGWAVVVAVGGDARRPVVVESERAALLPEDLPRQPYHAVAEAGERPSVVEEVAAAALAGTHGCVEDLLGRLRPAHEVHGAGIIGAPRELPPLGRILASHPLLHAAEGDLYWSALVEAVAGAGLAVTAVPAKRTLEAATDALGLRSQDLADAVKEAGRGRRPWRADHKEATAAALLVLGDPPGTEVSRR